MNLRQVLYPVAIAALAIAPIAATTSASAADDHSQTFVDTDETTPANAVNIVKTHLFTTATDYRAVVSYKTYNALKATRYNVVFVSFGPDEDASGNVLDLRINPQGKASVLAYGIDGETLVKSSCQGNKVFSGKNTLTFVVAKKCWYSKYAPDLVISGTKHYTSTAAYNAGGPTDTFAGSNETANSDGTNNGSTGGWDWGGPVPINEKPMPKALPKLHM